MRHLLNTVYGNCGATVADFVSDVSTADLIPTDSTPPGQNVILRPLVGFIYEPHTLSEQLFGFMVSYPRHLAQIAGEVVSGDRAARPKADMLELSSSCIRLGMLVDEYTAALVKMNPWGAFNKNAPLAVTRIWRDRNDNVIGEPEERNVHPDNVPSRVASLVMVIDDARPDRVMIALSDGRYKDDGTGGEAREDFLIDIPAMIQRSVGPNKKGYLDKNSVAKSCMMLNRMVQEGRPLLKQIIYVAEQLIDMGKLDDPDELFDRTDKFKERQLIKPEDSPNALIKIGQWA